MPLRYAGGKDRAKIRIEDIYTKFFNVQSEIISPFFGGGSFERHMNKKYGTKIIAGDVFSELINFWKICKSNKKELIQELESLYPKLNREYYFEMKKEIRREKCKIKKAALFYLINRSCFSGIMHGGYTSCRNDKKYMKSLRNVNLEGLQFFNEDYSKLIQRRSKDSVLFLDPPYHVNSTLYGFNGEFHKDFDHQALYDVLKSQDKWIMTYNNDEYIRTLYKDYTIIPVNWKYCGTHKTSQELVIIKE